MSRLRGRSLAALLLSTPIVVAAFVACSSPEASPTFTPDRRGLDSGLPPLDMDDGGEGRDGSGGGGGSGGGKGESLDAAIFGFQTKSFFTTSDGGFNPSVVGFALSGATVSCADLADASSDRIVGRVSVPDGSVTAGTYNVGDGGASIAYELADGRRFAAFGGAITYSEVTPSRAKGSFVAKLSLGDSGAIYTGSGGFDAPQCASFH